jgi:hypothetical protein
MKRDPYKNPIRIAGQPPGGWTFLEKGMKRPLRGASFWSVSNLLFQYRKANNMPGATFEQSQMDVLCKYRKVKGLSCSDDEKAGITEAARRDLKVKAFKARYKTGGCKSCGQKKRKVSV